MPRCSWTEVRRFRQLAPWIFKPTAHGTSDFLKTYRALRRSNEFDPCFYYVRYQDVARVRMDPLRHFVAHGWREGRNPNRAFDTGSLPPAPPRRRRRRSESIPPLHPLRKRRGSRRISRGASTPVPRSRRARQRRRSPRCRHLRPTNRLPLRRASTAVVDAEARREIRDSFPCRAGRRRAPLRRYGGYRAPRGASFPGT